MKSTPLEFHKMFEKYGDKTRNIFGCLLGRALCALQRLKRGKSAEGAAHNFPPIICIREARTDRLVNEENIRIRVPRERIRNSRVSVLDFARSKFHEQTSRRGTTRP